MNHPVIELFSAFAATSWRASWLILVVLGLRWAARRQVPAQVWCVAWLLVAVRLLLPISVPVTWSPFAAPAPAVPDARLVSPRAITAADVIPTPREFPIAEGATSLSSITSDRTDPVPPKIRNQNAVGVTPTVSNSAPTAEWSEILAAVWLLGVGLFGLTRIVAAVRLSRQLRAARPIADERVLGLILREAQALGSNAAPAACETDAVEAPALCGLLRPRLLFPRGLIAKLSDEELRLVVRHELGHWRRRDLATQALVHAAAVLHWWNPLVWVAARLARADAELACDEFVLQRETHAAEYGAALLKVLSVVRLARRPAPVIAILEGRHELAHRLRRIADYRGWSPLRLATGTAIMIALAAVSLTRETRADPATPAASSVAVSATPAPAQPPSVLFKKSGDHWVAIGDRADRERLLRQLENTSEFGNTRVFVLNTGQIVVQNPTDFVPGGPAPQSAGRGVELSATDAAQALKASLAQAPSSHLTPSTALPQPTPGTTAAPSTQSNVASEQAVSFIAGQVNRKRRVVDELAREMIDFKAKNQIASIDVQRDILTDRLKTANVDFNRQVAALEAAQARVDQINDQRQKGAPLTELSFVARQSLVAALLEKQSNQRLELSQLRERYKDQHPRMIEAEKGLAATEAELARATESMRTQLLAERDAARTMVDQRQQELGRAKEEMLAFDRVASEYNARQRELETQRQILTQLSAREAEVNTTPLQLMPARGASGPVPERPGTGGDFTISVVGAVNNQSGVVFSANDKPMVLDAIARAGGFKSSADRTAVRIIRTEAGERKTLTLSEENLMNGTGQAGALQRGDVVIVPEVARPMPRFVAIFGAVNKAGRIVLPEPGEPKMTIVELLAQAGGPTRVADLKRVQVARVNPKTHGTDSLTVDVAAFMRGGGDLASVELEPGDMVTVPERIL